MTPFNDMEDTIERSFAQARARLTLEALLFDLDGTLIDTMNLHYQAYRQVFASYGKNLDRADFDAAIGPPAVVAIPLFARAAGMGVLDQTGIKRVHDEKKKALETLLGQTELTVLPAGRLLRKFGHEFAIAVVTSGNKRGARTILAAAGLAPYIAVLVSADDVARGKPDPEPYEQARVRLGIRADQGLVFEDLDDGLQAAARAGFWAIDVRNGQLKTVPQ